MRKVNGFAVAMIIAFVALPAKADVLEILESHLSTMWGEPIRQGDDFVLWDRGTDEDRKFLYLAYQNFNEPSLSSMSANEVTDWKISNLARNLMSEWYGSSPDPQQYTARRVVWVGDVEVLELRYVNSVTFDSGTQAKQEARFLFAGPIDEGDRILAVAYFGSPEVIAFNFEELAQLLGE